MYRKFKSKLISNLQRDMRSLNRVVGFAFLSAFKAVESDLFLEYSSLQFQFVH